jgi:uncharacterized protein (DUF736 family)
MAYELRDGSGSLFRNERKQEGDRQPDYRGDAMVNGRKVEIAAWLKTSASGKRFLSLKFQEPRDQEAPKTSAAPEADFPF